MSKALFNTDEEWLDFIQRCRTSGMNDKDFCRQEGISQTSLYRHIRKLREKAHDIPGSYEQPHEVVQIEVSDDRDGMSCFPVIGSEKHVENNLWLPEHESSRIHIKCGDFRLDIDKGADRATLRDTLSILQKLC